jgi:hypothetical protein
VVCGWLPSVVLLSARRVPAPRPAPRAALREGPLNTSCHDSCARLPRVVRLWDTPHGPASAWMATLD